MPKYVILPDDAIEINQLFCEGRSALLFGKMGDLESALHQPYNGYYQTVYEQASALLRSLILNHCFVDGNKRTATCIVTIFLNSKGLDIPAQDNKTIDFIKSIPTYRPKGQLLSYITKWLEKNVMDFIPDA